MNSIKVFVEIGKKRVFAGAVDWPARNTRAWHVRLEEHELNESLAFVAA